jgi:DNA-binding CsgD family transcriptional regulator
MAKSAHVRLRDFRTILTLTHECRDLGDDPGLWRAHLFAGLCRLTGADVGMGGEMALGPGGVPRDLGTADWGWDAGFDRSGWVHSVVELRQDPHSAPELTGYFARGGHAAGACLSRRDYIPDPDWYRSDHYRTCYVTAGLDMTLVCFRELTAGAEFSGLLLSRAGGRPDFSARDRAVLAEAHAAIAPLVGGPLARFAEPSPADLPPRARQVLRCLLDGDGDKQVAARLGIRPLTVNHHVKHIYAHFGVTTRAELLARWVRRGWGKGFSWADG